VTLLEVTDLVVDFRIRRAGKVRSFRAIDRVSFSIEEGETVGLVGESGSGKSTIGRAILGLVAATSGTIAFRGEDITRAGTGRRRELAENIQAVFQDPYSSLDPRRTIEETLTEPLLVQKKFSKAEAISRVRNLLRRVRLPGDAAGRLPRDFSGGQRQRIAIARSLANDPMLVVCDEAVSALDVSTQAQVVNLLSELQADLGMSYLFISHDLSIVRYMCKTVVVLYRGRVMESGPAALVGTAPLHPYTQALLASAPVNDPRSQRARREARRLAIVKNEAPAEQNPDSQCPFAPRCPMAASVCWTARAKPMVVGESTLECHMFDPASGHPEAKTESSTV
jgi:oligopeptide/dipeptide ABC transporter ATP-binding protein